MPVKVKNQTPAELVPYKTAPLFTGDFDPYSLVKTNISESLFTPVNQANDVTISIDGVNVDADDVTELIIECNGDTISSKEATLHELFEQTLLDYKASTYMKTSELFGIQEGVRNGLPLPNPAVIYDASMNLIPTCKGFIAGKNNRSELFSIFALYTRVDAFGVYFKSESDFDAFLAYVKGEVDKLNTIAPLSTKTNLLFKDFQTLKLEELTESIIVRDNELDNNDEYSFARILMWCIINYDLTYNTPENYGIMPFDLSETYCPKRIVFINVEAHAHASASSVIEEWKIIRRALREKPVVLTKSQLKRLTTTVRAVSKFKANASSQLMNTRKNQLLKANNVPFASKQPGAVDFVHKLKRVIAKMANVARSENSYHMVKMTYARPNRRDPDDFNKTGKMVSTRYKPDIHIYLDTSGSISEENYKSAIYSLICMAKKLNVNLYFNAFTTALSQESKLEVKDKPIKAIYKEFQKLPKPSGGTDYEIVWNYILENKRRRRELSILITDFEYYPPRKQFEHPRNLYYVPCSNLDWDYMLSWANEFRDSMQRVVPDIRKKMLF